ncbi:MAG: aldo/keto reductase [Deltaproteobacteria bacterium]|nr:aldo/keto reductase [Deltaproteobacteria bacterium]
MKKRLLGGTGERIPVLGMGTWAIGGDLWGPADEATSIRAVRTAVDLGMTLVDTAPIYGSGVSEQVVGKALSGIRDQVFLSTKCGLERVDGSIRKNLSPEAIRAEIDASLTRLGTDHVDLYQCHWPVQDTPVEDTVGVLEEIRDAGKIRFWGLSNYEAPLIEPALAAGQPASLQSEYSLVKRSVEAAELPLCRARGLGFLAYAPMAGGLLTGKYDPDGPPPAFPPADARSFFYTFFSEPGWSEVGPTVRAVMSAARELGVAPGHVAVAWVLAQEGVTCALVGARTPEQAAENARAAEVELTQEIIERIEGAT